jgi:hypothetical protein
VSCAGQIQSECDEFGLGAVAVIAVFLDALDNSIFEGVNDLPMKSRDAVDDISHARRLQLSATGEARNASTLPRSAAGVIARSVLAGDGSKAPPQLFPIASHVLHLSLTPPPTEAHAPRIARTMRAPRLTNVELG